MKKSPKNQHLFSEASINLYRLVENLKEILSNLYAERDALDDAGELAELNDDDAQLEKLADQIDELDDEIREVENLIDTVEDAYQEIEEEIQ